MKSRLAAALILGVIVLVVFLFVFRLDTESVKCFEKIDRFIDKPLIERRKILVNKRDLALLFSNDPLFMDHVTEATCYYDRIVIKLDTKHHIEMIRNKAETKNFIPSESVKYKLVGDWHVFLMDDHRR